MFDDLEPKNNSELSDKKVEDIFSETEKRENKDFSKPETLEPMPNPDTYHNPELKRQAKKVIFLIIFMVILAVVIFASLFAINYFLNLQKDLPIVENDLIQKENYELDDKEDNITGAQDSSDDVINNTNQSEIINENALLQVEEKEFVDDNIINLDTDGDGLLDREEIEIYKTDPLNSDTDGDGYPDGEEIKAGYNPNGEGKLINEIK